MQRFTFRGYEINALNEVDDEHLCQLETDSAYKAVTACLDPSRRLDYLKVIFRTNGATFGEFSPYSVWGAREAFEEALRNTILATKVQLNLELSQERATEDLIVSALDRIRLRS